MAGYVTLSQALADLLPIVDSTANNNPIDIIGNKNDTLSGNSLMALLKFAANRVEVINDHLHNASKCYPTLANGKVVSGAAPAWTLGSAVEIIPAGFVPVAFNIYFINVEAASVTDVYEIVLYSGAGADVEIGRIRTPRNTDLPEAGGAPIACAVVLAGTKISAKVANKTAVAGSLTLSIYYIEVKDWQP
jgi:hypothetical protein